MKTWNELVNGLLTTNTDEEMALMAAVVWVRNTVQYRGLTEQQILDVLWEGCTVATQRDLCRAQALRPVMTG